MDVKIGTYLHNKSFIKCTGFGEETSVKYH